MTESTAAPPATAGRPRWDDYLEIFYNPSAVFARRAGTNPFIPLLVLVGLGLALYFATAAATQVVMEAELSRQMAKAMADNAELRAEQAQAMQQTMQRFAFIGVGLAMLVTPLLLGVVLWLVAKIVGSVASLGTAIVVAVFAYFPKLLEMIASAVQALVMDEQSIQSRWDVSLGAARFLDTSSSSAMLEAILGRIDVFTIWVTILLAIGIRITGRLTTGQAALVAVIVWIVGALPALMGAMRG